MNRKSRLALRILHCALCIVSAVAVADSPADTAETRAAFAAPFTSHAVLQRECPLPVWGAAAPGADVSVSLDSLTESAKADADGCWKVVFPAQDKPGLGHRLSLSVDGAVVDELDDIAIGDVWLCSGQSNMEMSYNWGITRGREDIEKADDPAMRLLHVGNALAPVPFGRPVLPTVWTPADFANSRTFSACGWFFGHALRKAMPDVPIGLIDATWSGSPIRTWLSDEAYRSAGADCAAESENYRLRCGESAAAEYMKRLDEWRCEAAAMESFSAEAEDFDDSGWMSVSLPSKFEKLFGDDFDGCVWYRREIDLTPALASGGATLSLGPIDDYDWAWVNGVPLGSNMVFNAPSNYRIPDGALRPGRNVIAVKAVDVLFGGGFFGKPEQLALTVGGETVPLAGEWRAKGFRGVPPAPSRTSCGSPSACFNAMLHPLFPMAVKGAIWYQGCADVGDPGRYSRVFRALAADWRTRFTHPDGLPIYIVQLAAFMKTHDKPFDSAWARMRWTQMRLGENVEKSGTAVAIDVGNHGDIHPQDKKTVGERLARLALARTYGLAGVVEAGPIPQAATLGGGVVSVTFKNADGLSTSDGGAVSGFQLVAADGRAVWADAAISGEIASVTVPENFTPVKVRFAWDDYPICNLVNREGLPCGPFELPIGD